MSVFFWLQFYGGRSSIGYFGKFPDCGSAGFLIFFKLAYSHLNNPRLSA